MHNWKANIFKNTTPKTLFLFAGYPLLFFAFYCACSLSSTVFPAPLLHLRRPPCWWRDYTTVTMLRVFRHPCFNHGVHLIGGISTQRYHVEGFPTLYFIHVVWLMGCVTASTTTPRAWRHLIYTNILRFGTLFRRRNEGGAR